MTVKEERKSKLKQGRGLYQFHSSSSSRVLALEDVIVSLFEGFVPLSGREGIKVVRCRFLESGVITLAMCIVLSLLSSRREGDKHDEGRGCSAYVSSADVRLVELARLVWWEHSMQRRSFVRHLIVAWMLVFDFW